MFSEAKQLSTALGVLLVFAIATAGAADQISVWEVVTTYRKHLDNGRLTLMSDGKTSKGLPWTLIRNTVDFGREGKASPRAGGAIYKGNWIGSWHINARVLMNNVALKTERVTVDLPVTVVAPVTPAVLFAPADPVTLLASLVSSAPLAPDTTVTTVVPLAPATTATSSTSITMPKTAGESLIGTKPSIALKDSIVDLWEFVAVLPRTNTFIRLTCDFTPNNLVLDGDRKIGTYEFQKRAVIVNFVDPQFGRIAFVEKQNNVLSGKGKPVNRKFWNLKFTRVQRQAVYRSIDNEVLIFYTNNRVNSPRYTPDYWTTFNWYYYTEGGKRRLACRSKEATLTANGRVLTWLGQKMVLIEGRPPR